MQNVDIPKLDINDKSLCETQLTLDDLHKALMSMANDKSPGLDGFTTNFYKFFWSELQKPLYNSYLYSFDKGQLSDGQRRGLLNLIPKPEKDLRYLKSWRPVSLLATDYKILAKALATKLQQVISTLVNTDQVGYVNGRFIGENIRIIDDMISFSSQNKLPGVLTLIDFEKAFDTIEWSFLLDTLKAFNFGETFINWIKLLYSNIVSCVSNNGSISQYFSLGRGIRQGCPISALLFILVAEIIAINIRSNEHIQGIKINEEIFKIVQLADDTTLFVKDLKSVANAIEMFNEFGKYSGLRLNLEKTVIIPLGTLQLTSINLPKYLKYIKIQRTSFKTLGVWFSLDTNISVDLNFTERIREVEKLLYIWSTRHLSWKGKITILKSLIVPKFVHLLNSIYTPVNILDRINKLLFNFLWNNKPARIKRSTIINDIENGGLKMPDIYSINKTQKISWIKRLCDEGNKRWKVFVLVTNWVEKRIT